MIPTAPSLKWTSIEKKCVKINFKIKKSTKKLLTTSNRNFSINGKNLWNKKCFETEDCGSVSLWKDINFLKYLIQSRTFMKKTKLKFPWRLKNNKWRPNLPKWKRKKRKAKRKRRNSLKKINSKKTTQDAVRPKLSWSSNKKLINTQKNGKTKLALKTNHKQKKLSKLFCLKSKTKCKKWSMTWSSSNWPTWELSSRRKRERRKRRKRRRRKLKK